MDDPNRKVDATGDPAGVIISVTCGGPRGKVHTAWVDSETALDRAITFYRTGCGMSAMMLGGWMREVDYSVTCRSCLRNLDDGLGQSPPKV